jgi:hypothetical protein
VLDGGKERPEILANKVLTMLKRAGQLCHACCMPLGGPCEPQSAKIGDHVLFVSAWPFRATTLYRFSFAPGRALCRAVKAMTSELDVEFPEWRAWVLVDEHTRESLRLWLAMNLASSASVSILRQWADDDIPGRARCDMAGQRLHRAIEPAGGLTH